MKKSQVEEAVKAVFKDEPEYFASYSHAADFADEMTKWNREDYSDLEKVVNWFQYFWQDLPDSPGIRWGAFWKVCDIAGCIFGFDDEEETQPQES